MIAARIPGRDPQRDRFRVDVPTDVSQVGEVVEAVVSCCELHGPVTMRTRFRLCTIVAEAVANAMVNGNRNDPSRHVIVEIELRVDAVVIGVTDEGDGFDPGTIPDPTGDAAHEATCGRGLFMIRSLADHVAFNARGNTIWMTLPRC